MLIQWDLGFLWNFYIGSSRNLCMLCSLILWVIRLYFDLQHLSGISTFSESPPTFCCVSRLQLVAVSPLMEALGTSGGTLSTFPSWPKVLASSRRLIFCEETVYLGGVSLSAVPCLIRSFAAFSALHTSGGSSCNSGPALNLLHANPVYSVNGPWERTGSLVRMHNVTGSFQNSPP